MSLGVSQVVARGINYASSSLLSHGNWHKIEIFKTGIQFVSDNSLNAMGFSDPEKVNVFGYGGKLIPENLDSPDDLPVIPSMRVEGGILFFGVASTTWELNKDTQTTYSHLSHPYSDRSFYYLSDCRETLKTPENVESFDLPDTKISIFTERLLHEQDLWMPMNSGRLMLGEDFKTNTLQHFNFLLKGNTGDAKITVAFGCKTSSGISSLLFTANGQQLTATTADRMNASSSKLIVTTKTTKNVTSPGENLDLTIKYNGSGSISNAGLDYIEVEYPRLLELSEEELYFYISPESASSVKIKGGTKNSIVWDVTDPTEVKNISPVVDDGYLYFPTLPGYHEYVVFNPEMFKNNVELVEKVENQDIHALSAPDMLIISPQDYIYAAQRLVSLHKQTDGLNILVLTPETIYNEFSSGKPDVSAFRKLLKMWYDRANGQEGEFPAYCLIMSRPTYDNKLVTTQVKNAGYPRVPIWQSPTGETESTSYSTDDYIGMLRDVDGDFNIGNAEINVAVARMPVKSLQEANLMIDKLENYLLSNDLGVWRNSVMIIADDQDNGIHLDQAEKVVATMKNSKKGDRALYEKLYLDAYTLEFTGVGTAYPEAHERMLNKWNEGVAFINYIGHANAKSWGHENLLTWTDINSMKNSRLPFVYAATCDFMRWDADDISGAEALWLLPNSGVIGMICPSREVLISSNGDLNKSTSRYVFESDADGIPLAVGDIMRKGKNDSNTGANKLRYGLIGDPSLKLSWPVLNVKVGKINGLDVDNLDEFPELKAMSIVNLTGYVEDARGDVLEDFNGILELNLYDAEKTVKTNGNGETGVESVYNDRKTRLFTGKVKVEQGRWKAIFTMPSEIENNYSPALLSMYAYEENGRTGAGIFDRFYVYGYDDNTPEDFEGPKILEFYLNSPAFSDGAEVGPNPVVFARFYDESGINLSEAGIGHSLSLELDNSVFLDNVPRYYTADEDNYEGGVLIYPLQNIKPGPHELKLTVWDNANNSSSATLNFNIPAIWKPDIILLTTDFNPASSNVNFIIETNGSSDSMKCVIEVYDLNGRRVWKENAPGFSATTSRSLLNWDLCDFSGARLLPGIYLYRATVSTEEGFSVAKTQKLIVR